MEKKQKKAAGSPSAQRTTRASNGVSHSNGKSKSRSNGSDARLNGNGSANGTAKNGKTTTAFKKAPAEKKQDMEKSQLADFFIDQLKDLYWAEKHLLKALAKMAKSATSEELRQAFLSHREETEVHVSRLEEVFEMIGKRAVAKKCDAMEGITKEVESAIEDTKDDTYTRDVALIIGGQKAEHYEIASYGGLIQLAMVLGHEAAAELLIQTLDEEKVADASLTSIAENSINEEALTETN